MERLSCMLSVYVRAKSPCGEISTDMDTIAVALLSNEALTTSNPESETFFTFHFTNGNNPSVHMEPTRHGNAKRRYPASHYLVRRCGGDATGFISQSDPIGSLYTMAATSASVIVRVLGTGRTAWTENRHVQFMSKRTKTRLSPTHSRTRPTDVARHGSAKRQ